MGRELNWFAMWNFLVATTTKYLSFRDFTSFENHKGKTRNNSFLRILGLPFHSIHPKRWIRTLKNDRFSSRNLLRSPGLESQPALVSSQDCLIGYPDISRLYSKRKMSCKKKLETFNWKPSQSLHGTWKWHPGIGDSFWKPSFLGSMLNLGRKSWSLWDSRGELSKRSLKQKQKSWWHATHWLQHISFKIRGFYPILPHTIIGGNPPPSIVWEDPLWTYLGWCYLDVPSI